MAIVVKLNDFQRLWEVVGQEVIEAVEIVGRSGWYVLGRHVEEFENSLARYLGIQHAVGVGNGLDAIEIGLRSLGISQGDKVLTTPLSAFPTTLAIMRVGANPVFCDVDNTGLIDLEQCRLALEKHRSIRFFVPVHLFGHSMDLDELESLRNDFELQIVEDCAQSIGASYLGRMAGTVGQVAATSFYPTKNLGALGDAGAILTQTDEIAESARSLRNYGQSATYVHDLIGLNSRLDELQAAVLNQAFLPRLENWTRRRREVSAHYRQKIINPTLEIPSALIGSKSVWHLFPILVRSGKRNEFIRHMEHHGVQTGIHYPRLITEQRALTEYGRFRIVGALDRARRFAEDEVSLPIHPLISDDEIGLVLDACNSWEAA